jgi:hypothetical protein
VFAILSALNHPPILLGSSSFTASGWSGSFYPGGMKPSDYFSLHAERIRPMTVRGISESVAFKISVATMYSTYRRVRTRRRSQ